MSENGFAEASALERDMLLRALPLVPTASTGNRRFRLDMATGAETAELTNSDGFAATPEKCVELLAIRPLLFGAAWKVLDLLLESAFSAAAIAPDQPRGFSIDFKRKMARQAAGQPSPLNRELWVALTLTYDQTAELRHSLVHRRAYINQTGSLVGTDSTGGNLRALSSLEQEAFARMALRASDLVIRPTAGLRVEADLTYQLKQLEALHHLTVPSVSLGAEIAELTVVLDPDSGGRTYALDIPSIRTHQSVASGYGDLTVDFRDRPGQTLRGRLEEAPNEVLYIDPDQPPDWLSL